MIELADDGMSESDEMDLLRQEVSDSMKTVMQYRSGNTELIECAMQLVQGLPTAEARARAVLAQCGMIRAEDGGLDWAALAKRKDNRWAWEEAVRKLVKQAEEVERLLAMGEGG